MARTEIRGGEQIKNLSILREDLVSDFLGGADWNLSGGAENATITGISEGVNDSDAVVMSQLNALEAKIGAPMRYKGQIDASGPTPDLDAIDNLVGDTYFVSVSGTLYGESVNAGDMIIINTDVPSGTTITSAEFDVVDNTEASDILRITSIVDNLTTQSAVLPLSANQGYVLDQRVQGLEAVDYTFVPLAIYPVTHNSPIVGDLAFAPVSGREAVFLNGLRVLKGSGNDYTISGSTIVFEYNLKLNDQVTVEYYY